MRLPPDRLIVMDCLRPLPLPVSTAETPGDENPDMLPKGFHWNLDHSRLSLRDCVLMLVAPATSPVVLTVFVRSGLTNTKYFVSHEMAIRYAARWVRKWESEIRLQLARGVTDAGRYRAVETQRVPAEG